MKICPKCGAEAEDASKFCGECGASLAALAPRKCPSCGAELKEGKKFCTECGAPVAAEEKGGAADGFWDDMFKQSEIAANEAEAACAREQIERALSPFEYQEHSDGTFSLTKLKDKTAMKIAVPEGVTTIEQGAFAGCAAMEIVLPESLLLIGESAFASCPNLMTVRFPENLAIVGDGAFRGCTLLDTELPESVKRVGKDVFADTANERIRQEQILSARKKRLQDAGVKVQGNYVEIGRWACGVCVDSPAFVSQTPDENGYYTDKEGNKYGQGNRYRDLSPQVNSDMITTYYRVMPIRWKIVGERNGRKLLVCDRILEYGYWGFDGRGPYEDSWIRDWMNEKFFPKAFTDKEKELICTVDVDNSAASTGEANNPFAGGITQDKVFALSVQETETYLKTPVERTIKMSEQLKILYKHFTSYEEMPWMTRSPAGDHKGYVWLKGTKGINTACGMVPAIEIEL